MLIPSIYEDHRRALDSYPMQHVEFIDRDHFERRYHRKKAQGALSRYIEYFWETDFEELLQQHPEGFSDALFPNVGYSYLINLGTPFVMQLDGQKIEMKQDGFLPRCCHMICHHSPGNRIFGIKFKVSPVILQKNINFSEYSNYIYPLAYLVDRPMIQQVKRATTFQQRIQLLTHHYNNIIEHYSGSLKFVEIVTSILDACYVDGDFDVSIEDVATRHGVSARSLHRYFEKATGVSSKKAIQVIRMRKALEMLVNHPGKFDVAAFGYYDNSHFHKHLKQFITGHQTNIAGLHLQLLKNRR